MIYDITFDRIGRHRDVPPTSVTVGPRAWREPGEAVESRVNTYARRYLASRGVEVEIDLNDTGIGTGSIYAGDRHVGEFTVTLRAEETP